ncbi:RNA polymerase sigma factor [Steroidobacter flavus]|uniref:RNA polymerase sigma factor n=1 Tax=Steroidobacter flavus TaxID=1842136 RepID=A0ABV8SY28_9GAMM
MGEAVDEWFKREVVVHEAALMRFLRRCWPHAQDLHDLRQETYIRVYEAAARSRPQQPKAFLFATAKHLIADRLRRQRVVTIDTVGDLETLDVIIDDVSPERRLGARQELRELARAFDQLPAKCRETVWLRRVDRLPQKQVAARLGVTEKTVEKHLMKGMRLLTEALFGAGASDQSEDEARRHESGQAREQQND